MNTHPFSRRRCLQAVAGLAATPLLRPAAAVAAREKTSTSTSTSLPIGFGTYGLPGYSLEEAIDLVAATGFDSIEFACMAGYPGYPGELKAARRQPIRRRLDESGLQLGALMGLPFPDAEKDEIDAVRAMLDLAVDLKPAGGKPPLMQTVLGGGDWEQKKSLYRDTIGKWLEAAAGSGVEISIKPHRGHAMSLPQHAVWLIEQLDAKGKLSLVYDASHYVHRGLDLDETVKTALPHTGYVVVKDTVQTDDGKVRFQLPGESGEMPHARILKQFHGGGYRGEVCCEVSSQVWKAGGYDPKAATETSHANLLKIFADAGLASKG